MVRSGEDPLLACRQPTSHVAEREWERILRPLFIRALIPLINAPPHQLITSPIRLGGRETSLCKLGGHKHSVHIRVWSCLHVHWLCGTTDFWTIVSGSSHAWGPGRGWGEVSYKTILGRIQSPKSFFLVNRHRWFSIPFSVQHITFVFSKILIVTWWFFLFFRSEKPRENVIFSFTAKYNISRWK